MVNMENYEEYMLLYADGELTPDEEQALLAFVAQHPHLQKELDAYAATILQPDTHMVFADKDSLLKKEEPKRIALLGNWKVYAAAASIILFAVIFAITNNSNNIQQVPLQAATDTTTPPEQIEENIQKEAIVKHDTLPTQTNHAEPIDAVAVKQQPAPQPRKVETVLPPKPNPVVPEPIVEQKQEEVLVIETPRDTIATQLVAKQIVQEQKEIQPPRSVATTPVEVTKKERQILAKVLGERTAGLQTIGDAMNDKLMAVKDAREELKDTEVHFRIGKKELFTVRL